MRRQYRHHILSSLLFWSFFPFSFQNRRLSLQCIGCHISTGEGWLKGFLKSGERKNENEKNEKMKKKMKKKFWPDDQNLVLPRPSYPPVIRRGWRGGGRGQRIGRRGNFNSEYKKVEGKPIKIL